MITIGATFDKMLKQRIFMLFNGNRGVTHTYNLTISTNKSQYDYGESIVVDGLLLRDNAPLPNVAIYIYKGDTLMGTVITDDNGAFSKSINNPTAGEYEIKAFYGSTESNKVNITTRRVVTSLDIDVPLSLVYSDAFNITGTLLDVNSSPLSNKSVKLKVGSTVVDTKTTNSNGVVSFTQTPVTMGTHTFQLIYDGDDTYSNISSPSVTRSINKETTVLTVTSPTNNTTIYTDGSISVSGSLVTNDNEKINGRTVYVKEGNTVITSYTTNSNGVFSGTITGLSASTHTLTFVFEGDSNYTGSSVSRNVIVNNHTYTLSLTADKNIIFSSESSTITALLKRDGIAYSSQTVSYTIKHGSTTISSGSKTTNSNGQATIPYTGTGVGNVSVIVSYGNALQQTYNLYDTITYDVATTSNYKDIWTGDTGALTRASEYSTFKETGGTDAVIGINSPSSNIRIEFDVYQVDGATHRYFYQFNQGGTYKGGGSLGDMNKSANNWTHVVIDLPPDGGYHLLSDGVNTPIEKAMSWNPAEDISFRLWTANDITELRFKNFMVYPYVVSEPTHNYSLSFAGDNIVSKNDVATITPTLKDRGFVVANKTLNYVIKHGNTTITSGTKTTDSNGQATIQYTGTGVGDVDVIVSYGSLLQETYEVLDTLYYDKAKSGTGNYNDNIWYHPYATLTRETDGTVITPTSTWGGASIGDTTSAILIPKNTIVEFDLITFVSDFIIQMRSGVQQSGSWVYCEPTKVVGHQKWEISSNSQKIYVDGVLKQTMSQNLGDSYRLSFLSQYSGKSGKIANFKIYSM